MKSNQSTIIGVLCVFVCGFVLTNPGLIALFAILGLVLAAWGAPKWW